MESSPFNVLLPKNVPHILERIFLSLDYETLKTCFKVSKRWHGFLSSEAFQKRAKSVFHKEILDDEKKLRHASHVGDTRKVRSLLFRGIMLNINCVGHLGIWGVEELATPLCEAAWGGHNGQNDVMKILLEEGADPNKGDKRGRTPLYVAAYRGNMGAVQMLLDAGADPNSGNSNGDTPLSKAADVGNKEMIKLLLERGASVANMEELHYIKLIRSIPAIERI